jgi:hypothetical protein
MPRTRTYRKKHIKKELKGHQGKNKRGGFKLMDTSLKGFEPIYQMLQSPNASLTIFTVSSLKGFMLKLTVLPEHSLYKQLNKSGSSFSEPITEFILKFVVITPNADEDLPNYLQHKKQSESAVSFLTEANLQQFIWLSSIHGGKPAICPPVGNCFLFDNANSIQMTNFYGVEQSGNPANGNVDAQNLFHYFKNSILTTHPAYGLGILVMPMIANSLTFSTFARSQIPRSAYLEAASSILAQNIRLMFDMKVLHLDLHMGNALVVPNGIKTLLIDFGRVSYLLSGKGDDFLNVDEKPLVLNVIDTILKKREGVMNPKRGDPDKEEKQVDYILECLEYMKRLDKNINKRYFQRKDVFQLEWAQHIQDNLEPRQKWTFLKQIYDKYYASITVYTYSVAKISNATLRRTIDSGAMVTSNFTPQTSVATFP